MHCKTAPLQLELEARTRQVVQVNAIVVKSKSSLDALSQTCSSSTQLSSAQEALRARRGIKSC